MTTFIDEEAALQTRLRRLHEAVERMLPIGLRAEEAFLLMRLVTHQPVHHGELRSRDIYFGTNPSYVLKKLEKAGYVSRGRSSVDQRTAVIVATALGRTIAETTRAVLTVEGLDKKPNTA